MSRGSFEGARPSRELCTRPGLDRSRIRGRIYPGAWEAQGAVRSRRRRQLPACVESPPGRSSIYRARAKVRRFSVANDLGVFCTLTYRHNPSPATVKATATRVLQQATRRNPLPGLWVAERGSKAGRLHVHLLCGSWLAGQVAERWDRGTVDVIPLGSISAIRDAAGYVAKDFDDPVLPHRYYKARGGFAPEVIDIGAETWEGFIEQAGGHFPGARLISHGDRDVRLRGVGVSCLWLPTSQDT